jgi:glycine oxidase
VALVRSVLIIGGGVIGCASALELAQAGCLVTLIDRGLIGGEASWAGAGLLSALLPWDYRAEVVRLMNQSRALYPDWIAGLKHSGVDPEYRASGLLVLPPYDLSQALQWARDSHEVVETCPANRIEPSLESEETALWMPQVAQVRNPRLLRALHQALVQHGVVVHESTALTGWLSDGSRMSGALTPRATLVADSYVMTTGAWSCATLGRLQGDDAPLPIRPMRGQIVLYKTSPGRLRHMLYRDGFYLIPRDDGHILAGSTLEDVGFDKQVTADARQLLMQRASALLPWLQTEPVVGHWAGLRPAAPDNLPIISRHPKHENLYMSSGHYRYGVTLAPASARALGDLILERQSLFNLQDFAWPT